MENRAFVPESVAGIPEANLEIIYTVPIVEQVGPTFQCDCACPEVPLEGGQVTVGSLPTPSPIA